MKVIVLCGGSGTRLWPLSRENFPKQFLRIFSERSLFQETILRAYDLVAENEIFVVTGEKYEWIVKGELEEIGLKDVQIITEPAGRNTAPAIALALKKLLDLGESPKEPILVLPSDHLVKNPKAFEEAVEKSLPVVEEGYIVLFGEKPSYPETGYGYIEMGEDLGPIKKVKRFVEKPSPEKAQEFLESGNFLWNCGIFFFPLGRVKEDYAKFFSAVDFSLSWEDFLRAFPGLESISFDYAILEKTQNIAVAPVEMGWSDVGSWKSVYDNLPKDGSGNSKVGDVVEVGSEGSLLFSKGGNLIACIGLKDYLVVSTEDATLIVSKEASQKVREVVEELKKRDDRRVKESVKNYTPFGRTAFLDEGDRYRIKKITINPGKSLPYRMHHHRTVHWIVLRGVAKVRLGEKEFFVHENESFFVRRSEPYKIENVGKIPLEMIEVQSGEYLGEDDVELV